MKTFEDPKGEAWEISLDYDTMRRVQGETGLDLTAALPGPLQVQQFQSPIQLIQSSVLVRLNVLWAICRIRADFLGVKRHQWEKRVEGRPLRAALEALNQELIDFFRRNECEAEAEFVLEMMTPWSQPHLNSAKTSPASSESTPAATPSAS